LSVNEKVYIIQTDLISTLQENLPYFQNSTRIENALLESVHFENSKYTSPFLSGTSILQKIIPSDHVGSKQGTGLVHIAPALGHDDFKIGLKHNLENRCVIDEQGKYTDDDEILKRFELEKMLVLNEITTAKIKVI
jgi:isoleucyl-tRNA synthetase